MSVRVPYRMTCCRWVRLLPKTHGPILLCLSQHPFILPVKHLHGLATIGQTLEYTKRPCTRSTVVVKLNSTTARESHHKSNTELMLLCSQGLTFPLNMYGRPRSLTEQRYGQGQVPTLTCHIHHRNQKQETENCSLLSTEPLHCNSVDRETSTQPLSSLCPSPCAASAPASASSLLTLPCSHLANRIKGHLFKPLG